MKNLSTELNSRLQEYKAIAEALRKELSPQEISEIEAAIKRLEELKITVSAFGETNAGKSALLNSLLGYNNEEPENCPFAIDAIINRWDDELEKKNSVIWREIQGLEIVLQDTPGIAGDFSQHLDKAKKIAENSDVILYVIFQAVKGDLQKTAMKGLLETKKPLIVVINQIDRQREAEINALKLDLLNKMPEINEDMIVLAAGHPMKGQPVIIEELVNKIILIIEQQQHNLILTTLEHTANKAIKIVAERIRQKAEEEKKRQEQLIRDKEAELAERSIEAESAIGGYATAAALSAGLIPFGIDTITSTLISAGMFYNIANIYGQKLDVKTIGSIAKELVQGFFSILFVSAVTLTGYVVISKGAKTNPFTYAIGMGLDYVFTYFIVSTVGYSFSYYCANDLSWGQKKNATEVLKEYMKKNIHEMFIDKIPERFRSKIIENINPDLLK